MLGRIRIARRGLLHLKPLKAILPISRFRPNLEQTEITNGVDTSNAIHHFNFDDGAGATVPNEQGNGDAQPVICQLDR